MNDVERDEALVLEVLVCVRRVVRGAQSLNVDDKLKLAEPTKLERAKRERNILGGNSRGELAA